MNYFNKQDLKNVLQSSGLYLTKQFGQNFLLSRNIIEKISSFIPSEGTIVEIGGGVGHLTEYLIQKNTKLIVIEIDKGFAQILNNRFREDSNFNLHHADFLNVNLEELLVNEKQPVTIIGNIPYNITTPILERVFKFNNILTNCFLTVQKEVAERIIAKPHSKTYGALSIFSQLNCKPKIHFNISPSNFFPPPKIYSSFIELKLNEKVVTDINKKYLSTFVKSVFSKRRKTIFNALRNNSIYVFEEAKISEILNRLEIPVNDRPENLSPDKFLSLATQLLDIVEIKKNN